MREEKNINDKKNNNYYNREIHKVRYLEDLASS